VCHLSGKKRVQVAFTSAQWSLIDKLRGEMGDTDANIIRNSTDSEGG